MCAKLTNVSAAQMLVVMVKHHPLFRRKQAERSEASLQVSEFSMNTEGAGEKIKLSDLLGSMEKAPNTTKKQLRKLQNSKETLELPLSRQQSEKVCV